MLGGFLLGEGPRFGVVFCGSQTDHGRWDGGNMEETNALAYVRLAEARCWAKGKRSGDLV